MCHRCKPNNRKIDKCMAEICCFIDILNVKKEGLPNYLRVVGSCCGHGKYPPSIIVRNHLGQTWDLISNTTIRRKTRFYLKDSKGYYFIPEVKNAAN